MMSMPAAAQQPAAVAQAPLGPTLVQSLDDARETEAKLFTAVTGSLLGAAGTVVAFNVVTGGAALTPVIGMPASNFLGGSWLNAIGSAPLAGQMAVNTIAVAVIGFGGGLMGNYFAKE